VHRSTASRSLRQRAAGRSGRRAHRRSSATVRRAALCTCDVHYDATFITTQARASQMHRAHRRM
jgi:hypothetical protein